MGIIVDFITKVIATSHTIIVDTKITKEPIKIIKITTSIKIDIKTIKTVLIFLTENVGIKTTVEEIGVHLSIILLNMFIISKTLNLFRDYHQQWGFSNN